MIGHPVNMSTCYYSFSTDEPTEPISTDGKIKRIWEFDPTDGPKSLIDYQSDIPE